MPELPEVETTRRGIEPHLLNRSIVKMVLRDKRLRWPVADALPELLAGQVVRQIRRRGKYLLVDFDQGTAMIHLGMSGSLRIVSADDPAAKHDHFDWLLDDGNCLRFTDPRRFGSLHWLQPDDHGHPLIDHLGPEPLSDDFSADTLYRVSRGRKVAVKQFIMNSEIVVGVGNIYANEALYRARIDPRRAAGSIGKTRYQGLVEAIKTVLSEAINQGGTTLRDFVGGDGKPGYFKQELQVYGRGGEPCKICERSLTEIRQGQRATVFCRQCQR